MSFKTMLFRATSSEVNRRIAKGLAYGVGVGAFVGGAAHFVNGVNAYDATTIGAVATACMFSGYLTGHADGYARGRRRGWPGAPRRNRSFNLDRR